ncbi:MAG: hypothetical protein ABFR90_05615 [Planctomycetota bacterium]
MLSHPLTFLIGYLVMTFIVSFAMLGPLAAFVSLPFRRKLEKHYTRGFYLGTAITAFAFMALHYALYLRGYRVTDWSRLFREIFYPPQYF